MKTLIAIPARYGSTRFPGKPLAKIAGKEMLLRVWENAQKTAAKFEDCHAVVATDDERIADFCKSKNIACVMTSPDCPTGTDRVVEAAESFADKPEFVVNLQGDNPICPPWFVEAVIAEYYNNNAVETVTPVVNLSWEQLDKLRENKRATPFSGTTAVFDKNGDAFYFSKTLSRLFARKKKFARQCRCRRFAVRSDCTVTGWTFCAKSPNFPRGFTKNWKGWSSCAGLKTALRFAA